MKPLIFILFYLYGILLVAQTGLGILNGANLQLHPNSKMGLYGDLANQGNLVASDTSLLGFYGTNANIVNGDPIDLYDVEFANSVVVFLQTGITVASNANFISGNVLTPYNLETVFLNFHENSFETGAGENSKVFGFAGVTGQQNFEFPVGYDNLYRPLLLQSETTNTLAKCAYLNENPSSPNSLLDVRFNTLERANSVGRVSNIEFWLLRSEVPSTVTITWNFNSNIALIANAAEELMVVGFHNEENRWLPLGANAISGDLNEGTITSDTFIPNDYGAITFGTVVMPTDTFAVNNPTLGNYFLSPNGDGTNDFLVIDNIADAGPNQLHIFNKFGQQVFSQANYTNEFNGVANMGSFIINQDMGLPEGVYYYIITLFDLELDYQGFLFLDR